MLVLSFLTSSGARKLVYVAAAMEVLSKFDKYYLHEKTYYRQLTRQATEFKTKLKAKFATNLIKKAHTQLKRFRINSSLNSWAAAYYGLFEGQAEHN